MFQLTNVTYKGIESFTRQNEFIKVHTLIVNTTCPEKTQQKKNCIQGELERLAKVRFPSQKKYLLGHFFECLSRGKTITNKPSPIFVPLLTKSYILYSLKNILFVYNLY